MFHGLYFAVVVLCSIVCCSTKPVLKEIELSNQTNDFFQGDIANVPRNASKMRNAIIFNKWPNARIPYVNWVAADKQSLVLSAMRRIEESTCVRFVPRTNEFDYVRIVTSPRGCFSSVGKAGGSQDLNLQDDSSGTCMIFRTVVHELLHAVGLWHEQSRADRDNYISVNFQNINQGDRSQFAIVGLDRTSYYGTQYDYRSVMHYNARAFSNNNQYTIVPKDGSYLNIIGRVPDASETDFIKVNKIYNCQNAPVQPATTQTELPQTTTPPTPGPCVDSVVWYYCSTWRLFCTLDKSFANDCKKTCNLCS